MSCSEQWSGRRHIERPRSPVLSRPAAVFCVPDFARVVEPENLLAVFRRLRETKGQAPGSDRVSYRKLSIREAANILRGLSLAIMDGRYRPHPTRPVPIPRPDGRIRELQLPTIMDRVIGSALHEALAPTIDAQLLDCCFGYRPGISVLHLLAALERAIDERGNFIVVTDDIRDAFPSVQIEAVLADCRQIIQDERLFRLLEIILRGDEGPSRTMGLDQGSAISPALLNLRLSNCLDRPTVADPAFPLLFRWADNLVFLGGSVSEGHTAIQTTTERLEGAGFRLKGEEGPPSRLSRQGGYKLILGYRVSWGNRRLRLAVPQTAWRRLTQEFERAYKEPNPAAAAYGIVRGWLGWAGVTTESVEDAESLIEACLTRATRYGFREVGTPSELIPLVMAARRRWEAIRTAARSTA